MSTPEWQSEAIATAALECSQSNRFHLPSTSLTFLVLQNIGGKAALVADIGGVFAVFLLDDVLQVVVDLGTNAHGLLEAARSHGEDHELLHGQLVACMGAAVDDVESLRKEQKGSVWGLMD